MNQKPSLFIAFVALSCLFFCACPKKSGSDGGNALLVGEWRANDGSKLKISAKTFTEGDAPEAEDYFVKGDTIYTSFQGNLPYTRYAIRKLDAHSLVLFTPDSVEVRYRK